ncbi:UDP-Glc:alpha-D-GlcNAc-diphosphoundecaprenol beta-1,3-glucosyltransferase WfgD [Flavobacterium anhuiense]|uniref:UDP-Glc:alpha-D-GlcNAc-diphosphoundecaprenol beta-1,3-glucosyltransferase WfgD n=1 Tax=Flavobacterium anhuiense TaxID=459526 RepID=A0AAC9D2L1_9FLAO|nr:glycosyltransferase family A protein [Flavobacterium anhuiense]AOC95292.1 UDP-Glc:alpha-D-GlcNAc-diphosphoundecaprenol beta-1,3-glucosyltransferase WfgD [Flavobacterium anhuiense]
MKENNNLVSVIIPAYNAANTIIRALDSVYNQTYKNIELIVVNDGSKDDTLKILKKYKESKLESTISFLIIDKPNGGVSSARNSGLKSVNGDFIAFLDSDDEWFPEKLHIQVKLLLNNKIDFLGSAFEGLYMKNKTDGELIKINLRQLIFKNYFQPSTVIMKSDVLREIGFFDENQKYAEEGNYFMRIANKFNCFFLNKKIINFSNGKRGFGVSGLSANLIEMEKGELKNLKFAYQNQYISFPTYSLAVIFSVIKFARRWLIVKIDKLL